LDKERVAMNDMTPVIDRLSAEAAHKLLRERRSVRCYRPEMPDIAIIERILVSAGMAPSAHNRQPWRYRVIADPTVKTGLATVMGSRLAADRRADGDAETAIDVDVIRSHQRIVDAPVVIVVALTRADMDPYPDERRRQAEYVMAVQSTAMATQNLLLAANAEGLGACWMCAPLFCPQAVRSALAMPQDWEPQALITLGYPARPGKLKPRRPLQDFVSFC
jgi:F420 biosynthesis protein FbiB-like protein